jgi:hypothetical protein
MAVAAAADLLGGDEVSAGCILLSPTLQNSISKVGSIIGCQHVQGDEVHTETTAGGQQQHRKTA